MSTAFVLGINMSVAGIFALAFAIVAATNRTARGAWWLALGYGMGQLFFHKGPEIINYITSLF